MNNDQFLREYSNALTQLKIHELIRDGMTVESPAEEPRPRRERPKGPYRPPSVREQTGSSVDEIIHQVLEGHDKLVQDYQNRVETMKAKIENLRQRESDLTRLINGSIGRQDEIETQAKAPTFDPSELDNLAPEYANLSARRQLAGIALERVRFLLKENKRNLDMASQDLGRLVSYENLLTRIRTLKGVMGGTFNRNDTQKLAAALEKLSEQMPGVQEINLSKKK